MPYRRLAVRWRHAIGVLGLSMLCMGAVAVDSNLSTGYPPLDCGEKPAPPERPEVFESEADLAAFNREVEKYNATVDGYFACVQRYVNNAAADIKRIRRSMKTAIEIANQ